MLLLTCVVSFHRRSIFKLNRDDFSMLRIFFNSEYQHQLGILRRFGSNLFAYSDQQISYN